jgi:hypothetical protein
LIEKVVIDRSLFRGKHKSQAQRARSALRAERYVTAKHHLRASFQALSPPESQPEPDASAAAPEPAPEMEALRASFQASSPPESQPDPDASAAAPEPAPEMEALAELNRVLKKKLKRAVTAANACHSALQRERKEGDEDVSRLQYALMIERAAHHQLKDNPRGHPKMPTPAEVQARMAAEEAKKAKEEHRRQAQIERDLRRKLVEQMEREKQIKGREAEAKEELRKRKAMNAESQQRWLSPAVQAGAKAIAVLKGRTRPIIADFREFYRSGPPRPDGHPRA